MQVGSLSQIKVHLPILLQSIMLLQVRDIQKTENRSYSCALTSSFGETRLLIKTQRIHLWLCLAHIVKIRDHALCSSVDGCGENLLLAPGQSFTSHHVFCGCPQLHQHPATSLPPPPLSVAFGLHGCAGGQGFYGNLWRMNT